MAENQNDCNNCGHDQRVPIVKKRTSAQEMARFATDAADNFSALVRNIVLVWLAEKSVITHDVKRRIEAKAQ